MSRFNLDTGDILLFDDKQDGLMGIFSGLVEYFTESPFSHVAMVLKNPTFIHPALHGYYIWQSGWQGSPDPQDGRVKLGVQLTPFEDMFQYYKQRRGRMFLRRFQGDRVKTFSCDKLKIIHDVVYDKPYDLVPMDWVNALRRQDKTPQKTNRFWCSALVGYIYTQCGVLDKTTDWSILRPGDFGVGGLDIPLDKTQIQLL